MPAQLTVGSFDGDDNIAVCEKCQPTATSTITMEQLAPYYVTIEGESMALCPRHAKTLVLAYFKETASV